MNCKPCRVTFNGVRYEIAKDGTVTPMRVLSEPVPPDFAANVRREAARQRANRNQRERYQAMRDLGLVRVPGGWE